MILQSLHHLYDRLKDDVDYNLPTPGYSLQKITFCVVLNPDGSLHDIQDARETHTQTLKSGTTKPRQVPRSLCVPGKTKPSGQAINPCTLWDNSGYLLGYKKPDRDPEKAKKDRLRSLESFDCFKGHHVSLENEINDPAFGVVCRFLKHWNPESIEKTWTEKLDDFAVTGNGVFRVRAERHYVHESPVFKQWWNHRTVQTETDEGSPTGICLVTGQEAPIARLHEPAIKGVAGAAPGGAKLVSFNINAFESYSKEQSFNAPVSEKAASQYSKALYALLDGRQKDRHRVIIGGTTIVFWSERKTITESLFAQFFKGETQTAHTERNATEENEALRQKLQAFLMLLRRGGGSFAELGDEPDTKFYLLGLSGNVTRLVVRFWHVNSIREIVKRLRAHFEALRLDRRPNANDWHQPEFPSVTRLLEQTARDSKAVQPLLNGQLMQAILHGTHYPMTLYQGVINRLRANDTLSYLKAAIIKAVLIRNFNQTIDVSLNTERTEPAYLLGRLFAALEKTQEDALPGINSGIRERFYSSASATPASVFPRMLRTYQHHHAKLSEGLKVNRERLVQRIHAPLNGYPAHLNLEEQGLFAIGYYHQREDFFRKKETTENQQQTKGPQHD